MNRNYDPYRQRARKLQKQLVEAEDRIRKLETRVCGLKKQQQKLIDEANDHINKAINQAAHFEKQYNSLKRIAHPDYYAIADRFVSLCNELQGLLPVPFPVCLQFDLEELALLLDVELAGRSVKQRG